MAAGRTSTRLDFVPVAQMGSVWWQRRLEEEEEEARVLEEVMRRSEGKVFAHSWEDARFTVESQLYCPL